MTRLAVALAVVLAACNTSSSASGSVCSDTAPPSSDLPSDETAAFVGQWTGTLTTSFGGAEESRPATLTIQRSGENALALDACSGGPPAVVTGALTFQTVCWQCLPVNTASCPQLSVKYESSAGTLSAGGETLEVSLTGTAGAKDVTGCPALDTPLVQSFSGTRTTAGRAGAAATGFAPAVEGAAEPATR
jgi:hypothetical protein